MKPNIHDKYHIGLLACFVLLTSTVSFAADGIRTERVQFEKGATSAVVEASIKGHETVDYVLRARAGQYMNVSLATKHGATYFNILAPGQNEIAMFNGSVSQNQYEGTLPASGDYTIRVYMMRSAALGNEIANYRLEMVVDDGEAAGTHAPRTETMPAAPKAGPDLKSYDEPAMAITTKYPDTMTVEAYCSGEGCGFFFKFKPQNSALDQSEVHLFLPAGAKTTKDAEIGLDSLMQGNGWETAETAPPAPEFKYPWVKKIITFRTEQGMYGYIIVGEIFSQGVRAVLLYPAELYKTFMPAAESVLDNLQFKPDKLPITTRG